MAASGDRDDVGETIPSRGSAANGLLSLSVGASAEGSDCAGADGEFDLAEGFRLQGGRGDARRGAHARPPFLGNAMTRFVLLASSSAMIHARPPPSSHAFTSSRSK